MIFFSAHGVPVSYVEEAGDPYRDQMEECIFLIMQELKARGISNEHTLAYQVFFNPFNLLFLHPELNGDFIFNCWVVLYGVLFIFLISYIFDG